MGALHRDAMEELAYTTRRPRPAGHPSVSHLLHMAFFPGLYDSRGQLCFVNPTMQSRTCLQLAVLPRWAESRAWAWQAWKVACLSSPRAALLSVTYPMASRRW